MRKTDIKAQLDQEIWECICDTFWCDIIFHLDEAVEAARKGLIKIRMLSYDYATERVLGALRRIDAVSKDIEQVAITGDYAWILPSRGHES